MREIKFRAWDGEQFLYGIMPSPLPSRTLDVCRNITNGEPEYYNMVDIIEGVESIEQYTGLEDKNGKEIYEGDIMSDGNVVRFALDDEVGSCGCCVEAFWGSGFIVSTKTPPDVLEVVGNIHENPELLKGDNDVSV